MYSKFILFQKNKFISFFLCVTLFCLCGNGCFLGNDTKILYVVKDIHLSKTGEIEIFLASFQKGNKRCVEKTFYRTKDGDRGSCDSSDTGYEGEILFNYKTSDASSVKFLVKKGENFYLRPGEEKQIAQFTLDDGKETPCFYVIRIDEKKDKTN